MTIKSDRWIKLMVEKCEMIHPFEENLVRQGVISYGLSSYGYDMRLSDEFKVFKGSGKTVIDPKKPDPSHFVDLRADFCDIPANSFVLGRSVEYFRIPRNVITITIGKSTYARCGVIINVTPFEPEWEGYVTLEITNTAPVPARVYAGEGIAQVLFFESDEECRVSYKDRKGKYQAQKSITFSRF
jgi:dCTP deaminase